MTLGVAFLRGMNLGGRRITNVDLAAHVSALGWQRVAIYRASGNVIFEVDVPPTAAEQRLEIGLHERLGYPVDTFVRTGAELAAMVDDCPFPADVVAAGEGKVQVTLYRSEPSDSARAAVLSLSTHADRLAFVGRELYWLPEGKMSDSNLEHSQMVRLLGHGTTRTLGTLENLRAKVCS